MQLMGIFCALHLLYNCSLQNIYGSLKEVVGTFAGCTYVAHYDLFVSCVCPSLYRAYHTYHTIHKCIIYALCPNLISMTLSRSLLHIVHLYY